MTRDKIFQAASDILARDGLQGLSMRRIAAQAGLSPMALYRHFADKDALINALMDHGFAAWDTRVRTIAAADPLAWLDRLLDAFLAFALEEPHLFDAAFFLPASRARQFPDDFAAQRSPSITLIVAQIAQAKADGLMGGGTAQDIALTLWALGQGLVSLYRAQRFADEAQFRILYHRTLRQYLATLVTPANSGQS